MERGLVSCPTFWALFGRPLFDVPVKPIDHFGQNMEDRFPSRIAVGFLWQKDESGCAAQSVESMKETLREEMKKQLSEMIKEKPAIPPPPEAPKRDSHETLIEELKKKEQEITELREEVETLRNWLSLSAIPALNAIPDRNNEIKMLKRNFQEQ